MNISITSAAARFYKQEVLLGEDQPLRLFVRVGGVGSGGFSVGISKEKPTHNSYHTTVEGITFFITEDDAWYFEGMTIDYNEDLNMMIFSNPQFEDIYHPEQ
ncbi:iron-sulfur cluster biosynthesis family protein [Alkalihalobacterium elongatum]|uniref:iron-sulfur cluster biosynthesis family protein n=1 Tax=Alkalihalobacterium elongatum TaxID=2675466 RepID=UPI001C1F1FAE|nr:iron-sulfur cluster biosynthesis family protein [Alkalihalobacterium elongatum]